MADLKTLVKKLKLNFKEKKELDAELRSFINENSSGGGEETSSIFTSTSPTNIQATIAGTDFGSIEIGETNIFLITQEDDSTDRLILQNDIPIGKYIYLFKEDDFTIYNPSSSDYEVNGVSGESELLIESGVYIEIFRPNENTLWARIFESNGTITIDTPVTP